METLCPSSSLLLSNSSSSSWLMHAYEGNSISNSSSTWTKEENKIFESALAIFDEETPDRWFKVAAMIPTKSVYDVINQYRELVADVTDIEAGFVPVPGYLSSSFSIELHRAGFDLSTKTPAPSPSPSRRQERKKGIPWTEAEHRRFLLGLEKHGKGDWKNISRNYVVSKTPTQVASHAQKYYMRQLSGGKDKRRPSIHDISIHLTGSPPSTTTSNSKPCFLKRPDDLTSLHSPQDAPTLMLDWNNDIIFDTEFVAYPYKAELL